MLKQYLSQKLSQKLSPQQIQFIKLLQVPTSMLETRIQQELEENPALEDGNFTEKEEKDEYDNTDEDFDKPKEEGEAEEFNIDDYLQEDIDEGYKYQSNNDSEDPDKKEMPLAVSVTFHDQLISQLNTSLISDVDFVIAHQIIGSIDNHGYLRRPVPSLIDDLAFLQNVIVTQEEVENVLHRIQQFDPAGVGARDLKECLMLQLNRKDHSHPDIKNAIEIVSHHMDEFTKKHYDKIEHKLGLRDEELRNAIHEITKLNPRPGDTYSDSSINTKITVTPDFIITKSEGELKLTLNSKNAPELRVSKDYLEMFDHYDKSTKKDKKMKEAVQFVKQKLDGAKWFIDAIRQRQQTLLKTMSAILEFQYEYFMTGDERDLKPMILQDIASKIEMDLSTVSRVTNSKYVQTEFGTFLLKSFFSEALQTEDGEEVSSKEVKKILENCILAETKRKPYSDEQLAEILKEKGYTIARRTVTKYREQLNIPVARLRKEV